MHIKMETPGPNLKLIHSTGPDLWIYTNGTACPLKNSLNSFCFAWKNLVHHPSIRTHDTSSVSQTCVMQHINAKAFHLSVQWYKTKWNSIQRILEHVISLKQQIFQKILNIHETQHHLPGNIATLKSLNWVISTEHNTNPLGKLHPK